MDRRAPSHLFFQLLTGGDLSVCPVLWSDFLHLNLCAYLLCVLPHTDSSVEETHQPGPCFFQLTWRSLLSLSVSLFFLCPCLLCFCLYLLLSHSSIPDSPLSFFSFLSVNFLSFESLSIPSEGRWARPGGTGVHKYSTISCLCCGVSGMSLRPVPRRNQTKM